MTKHTQDFFRASVVALFVLLCGCEKSSNNLLGEWYLVDGSAPFLIARIVFTDAQFVSVYGGGGKKYPGTYTVNDGQLKVVALIGDQKKTLVDGQMKISDGMLTIATTNGLIKFASGKEHKPESVSNTPNATASLQQIPAGNYAAQVEQNAMQLSTGACPKEALLGDWYGTSNRLHGQFTFLADGTGHYLEKIQNVAEIHRSSVHYEIQANTIKLSLNADEEGGDYIEANCQISEDTMIWTQPSAIFTFARGKKPGLQTAPKKKAKKKKRDRHYNWQQWLP